MVVIVAASKNKMRMSLKITKYNICLIGMVLGIGLIGLLPVLHGMGVLSYRLF